MSSVKIHTSTPDQFAIVLTEAALDHVRQYLTKRGEGIGIRVGIKQRGCSGYAYEVDFIDNVDELDHVFIQEDIYIAVAPSSFLLIRGTIVDYVREGLNFKFVFNNPNQTGACGCGESFTVN